MNATLDSGGMILFARHAALFMQTVQLARMRESALLAALALLKLMEALA